MKSSDLEKIIGLRRTLHQHSELSLQETETMKILQTFLQENTSLEIHKRDGWFYALKKGSALIESDDSNSRKGSALIESDDSNSR